MALLPPRHCKDSIKIKMCNVVSSLLLVKILHDLLAKLCGGCGGENHVKHLMLSFPSQKGQFNVHVYQPYIVPYVVRKNLV